MGLLADPPQVTMHGIPESRVVPGGFMIGGVRVDDSRLAGTIRDVAVGEREALDLADAMDLMDATEDDFRSAGGDGEVASFGTVALSEAAARIDGVDKGRRKVGVAEFATLARRGCTSLASALVADRMAVFRGEVVGFGTAPVTGKATAALAEVDAVVLIDLTDGGRGAVVLELGKAGGVGVRALAVLTTLGLRGIGNDIGLTRAVGESRIELTTVRTGGLVDELSRGGARRGAVATTGDRAEIDAARAAARLAVTALAAS